MLDNPAFLFQEYKKDPDRILMTKERDIVMPLWKGNEIVIDNETVKYEDLFFKLEELLEKE